MDKLPPLLSRTQALVGVQSDYQTLDIVKTLSCANYSLIVENRRVRHEPGEHRARDLGHLYSLGKQREKCYHNFPRSFPNTSSRALVMAQVQAVGGLHRAMIAQRDQRHRSSKTRLARVRVFGRLLRAYPEPVCGNRKEVPFRGGSKRLHNYGTRVC